MVRQIKVARDTAVKAKSAAIITLKTLIVNAPVSSGRHLEPLTDRKLIDRCARLLRPAHRRHDRLDQARAPCVGHALARARRGDRHA